MSTTVKKLRLIPVGDKEEVNRVYRYISDGQYNQYLIMNSLQFILSINFLFSLFNHVKIILLSISPGTGLAFVIGVSSFLILFLEFLKINIIIKIDLI